MNPPLNEEEILAIHEEAAIIEDIIKKRAALLAEHFNGVVVVNVILNAGVSLLAGGLSTIDDETERIAATIKIFTAVVAKLKLEMVEHAADSIIKKAMKK